jgi:hypothetical protein
MSLREDDKSVEAARSDPELLGRVDVSSISFCRSDWAHQLYHVQDHSLSDYDDPNFDPTATIFQDESPYFEVRAAVANTDNPRMPSSTFRAWTIGLFWTILVSGINQVLVLRYPTASINSVCAL